MAHAACIRISAPDGLYLAMALKDCCPHTVSAPMDFAMNVDWLNSNCCFQIFLHRLARKAIATFRAKRFALATMQQQCANATALVAPTFNFAQVGSFQISQALPALVPLNSARYAGSFSLIFSSLARVWEPRHSFSKAVTRLQHG